MSWDPVEVPQHSSTTINVSLETTELHARGLYGHFPRFNDKAEDINEPPLYLRDQSKGCQT